jgi:hypothetical protein
VRGKGIAIGRIIAYAEFLKVQVGYSETALKRAGGIGA